MDQQRSQSQGNHATNFQHVELQRAVSTGRFLLLTHFSHSGSRTWCWEQTDPKSLHGPRQILDSKKSIIKIQNDDELCCAHAIVIMKAYCDLGSHHPEYVSLRRGKPLQGRQAQTLHCDAGVPEGPCGLPELTASQCHLTDHQIMVLSMDHNYQIIFKGPPQDKHIVLFKVGDHYHGCNSLLGFLGTNHFCCHCETSYTQDDINHHPCKGKKCLACHQTGCPDFSPGQSPCNQCPRCHCSLFGE